MEKWIKWILLAALAYGIYSVISGTAKDVAAQASDPIEKVKDAIKQVSYIPQNLFLGSDSRSENGVVYPTTPVLGAVYDPIFDWMKEHGYDINKGIKLYG